VAREALRLSFEQHKAFATGLKGIQQQRTVGDAFAQEAAGATLVDPMKLDLLVASGGVLSHAPRMEQTALMLIDSFEPEGFTELAKDSIFMMPHLGVLASVHPDAAMEVFEKDCLVHLGTCVAPRGQGKAGKPCFSWRISGARDGAGTVECGEIRLVPLAHGEECEMTVAPERGFDMGAGPGKPVTRRVRGGTVGLVLDGRGRSIEVPAAESERRATIGRWLAAMRAYE
jgi:hypothetical protein